MKVVIQRAKDAKVTVNEKVVGAIDHGLVALVGVTHDDTLEDVRYLVNKIVNLRIFEDDYGKMNKSLKDVDGSVLSISQFTLHADTRKGRRPNFMQAASPDHALELYNSLNDLVAKEGVHVETGAFGEMMDVKLTNSGPVTISIDSHDK